MLSSPTTPQHSRHSSTADSIQGYSHARLPSKSSAHDLTTPFTNGLPCQDSMDLSVINSGGPAPSFGMGNLADELADAFSDSGEEYDGEYGEEQGPLSCHQDSQILGATVDGTRDSGVDVESTPTRDSAGGNDALISLLSPTSGKGHQGRPTDYDGSEYGSESDLDAAEMPPILVAKIDAIESLARRGAENYGGPQDDVFRRVTSSLRDLGSQSAVEGNASRLITAHTALTTHLAHQTRQLHGLTYPLLSPLAPAPDSETVDGLIPLLVSLSEKMPRPSTSAFHSLTALHSVTTELIQTLSYLSDTLHMSRQTTATATRRLKSAKELVSEMRHDEELREQGERWLTQGNWNQRLEGRECANVCGEVIGGFEDVCNGWRKRLLAQAESQA